MSEIDETDEQDLQHEVDAEEDVLDRGESYQENGLVTLCVQLPVLINGMLRSISIFPAEKAFQINGEGLDGVDYALDEVRFICPDYSNELTVVYFQDRIRVEFISIDDKNKFVQELDVKGHELRPVNPVLSGRHWMDDLFGQFADEVEEETFVAEEASER